MHEKAKQVADKAINLMQENPHLTIIEVIEQAKLAWEVAQDKFNWATGEDVTVAALQLTAAEAMLNRTYKIAKEEGVTFE